MRREQIIAAVSGPPSSSRFPYLDDIVEAPFAGGLVLVRKTARKLCLLNGSGALAWRLYHEEGSVERAAFGLAETYDIGKEAAADAVTASLEEWRAAGLLDAGLDVSLNVGLEAPAGRTTVPPVDPSAGAGIERAYRLGARGFRIRYSAGGEEALVHSRLEHISVEALPTFPLIEVRHDDAGFVISASGTADAAEDGAEAVGLVFRRIVEIIHPESRWIAHLHAAAVRLGEATLLLPGSKGAGKSTLTAALVHAGAAYLSDDVVFLDERCRAVPLPVRLAVKEGSWDVVAALFPELRRAEISTLRTAPIRYIDPEPQGAPGEAGKTAPHPVNAIVFPRYRPEGPAELRPLPPEEALIRLVEDRTWFSCEAADVATWTDWLMRVPAFSLEYASLDEAVPLAREASSVVSGLRSKGS